jgi:hypothetical protein
MSPISEPNRSSNVQFGPEDGYMSERANAAAVPETTSSHDEPTEGGPFDGAGPLPVLR